MLARQTGSSRCWSLETRGRTRRSSCLPAAAVGQATGAVVRQGSRNDVVVFSADANGGELTRAAVDVNLQGRTGDLTIATLTPGARYSVRMGGGSGRVQRIAIATTSGAGVTADAAGIVRMRLDEVPRIGGISSTSAGSGGSISGPGAGAATAGGTTSSSGGPTAGAGGPNADAGTTHPGLVPGHRRHPRVARRVGRARHEDDTQR